jgi:hypothetical protein
VRRWRKQLRQRQTRLQRLRRRGQQRRRQHVQRVAAHLQPPSPRASIFTAAADHGIGQLEAELALNELLRAGLATDRQRRTAMLKSISIR